MVLIQHYIYYILYIVYIDYQRKFSGLNSVLRIFKMWRKYRSGEIELVCLFVSLVSWLVSWFVVWLAGWLVG